MVERTKVLYSTQAVNDILSISRLISKGATMGITKTKLLSRKMAST